MDKSLIRLFKSVRSPLVRFNEPMNRQTTFRIGGPAEVFIVPQTFHQIRATYNLCRAQNVPIRILGAGSNLLVNDRGVKGVVIKIINRDLIIDKNIITVGAGYPLGLLITKTAKSSLSGLEPLVGIPGTIGGAVVMNAGGKYGDISRVVKAVAVVDKTGRAKTILRPAIKFGYRTSSIKEKNYILYNITLGLKKDKPAKIRARIRKILTEKRSTQPLSAWSAGCVFKNPPNQSAGALIDRAGLKGKTIGGAMVSAKHANFIVNTGKARASHVLHLINHVKKTIYNKYKVKLDLEIQAW